MKRPSAPRRRCAGKAIEYVTYNLRRATRVAKERPCNATPMKGSEFCWHHRDRDQKK